MKEKAGTEAVAPPQTAADALSSDRRFKAVLSDPKFSRLPRRERKVVVDSRFQGMFDDPNFALTYKVDKRGRPVKKTTSNNLRRYYDMQSDDLSSSGSEAAADGEQTKDHGARNNRKAKSTEKKQTCAEFHEEAVSSAVCHGELEADSDQNSRAEISDLSRKQQPSFSSLPDISDSDDGDDEEPVILDLARGEGNLESSDGEDSSTEWQLSDTEAADIDWAELDKAAPRIAEDAATHRLAVCNQDWDRIKAKDLLVLFASFLPSGGSIKRVAVYPSEFGIERMRAEELHGPFELKQDGADDMNSDDDTQLEDSKGLARRNRDRLRLHQLNRLKYFYAIVECDSSDTANALYTACDGIEYETSGCRLDVRFVPENETFDTEPRDCATEADNLVNYKPALFVNSALQQSKVELTWDETDYERQRRLGRAFEENSLSDAEIHEYVASSSGSSDADDDDSADDKASGKEQTSKAERYRKLLDTLGSDERNPFKRPRPTLSGETGTDLPVMNVSWESGFNGLSDSKSKDDKEFSAHGIPVIQSATARGMRNRKPSKKDADFFRETDLNEEPGLVKRKKKRRPKLESHAEEDDAELALLVGGDDSKGKRHFNLKTLVDAETRKKRPKPSKQLDSRKQSQSASRIDDEFEMDVKDRRFSAVFALPDFSIDPSASQFKKTAGMKLLLNEKLRRLQQAGSGSHSIQKASTQSSKSTAVLSEVDEAAQTLAEKLKRKSSAWKANKRHCIA